MRDLIFKNTFHFLIYKGKEGYVGICYETGFVDVWTTMEEAKKHLEDGVIALLKTVESGQLSKGVLNRKPPFKYRALFHILPLWSGLFSFKIPFSVEPFTPRTFANA